MLQSLLLELIFRTKYLRMDQVNKTTFKKFEGIWSTNFTWSILEYFVPFIIYLIAIPYIQVKLKYFLALCHNATKDIIEVLSRHNSASRISLITLILSFYFIG